MTAPVAPRGIEALDVPLATVQAQALSPVLRAELAATNSPSDRIAYAWDLELLAHPEWCSTDADYPNWTPGGAR